MSKEITMNRILYLHSTLDTSNNSIIPINTENCVICLEEYDENNNTCDKSINLITSTCNCNYLIHKSCLNTWGRNNQDNITCLICASDAQLINSSLIEVRQKKCLSASHKNLAQSIIISALIVVFWLALAVDSLHKHKFKHVKHNSTNPFFFD